MEGAEIHEGDCVDGAEIGTWQVLVQTSCDGGDESLCERRLCCESVVAV